MYQITCMPEILNKYISLNLYIDGGSEWHRTSKNIVNHWYFYDLNTGTKLIK